MSDDNLIKEMLLQLDNAAKEIGERFEPIKSPEDFESSFCLIFSESR